MFYDYGFVNIMLVIVWLIRRELILEFRGLRGFLEEGGIKEGLS